jgi:alpha-glucosidase
MKPRFAARRTTDAHEMALAVVFESGWQCISASPEGLRGHPARGFLQNVPTAWDDTRCVAGRPDEYAVLARRKGDKWYVAGINADRARTVRIPMAFLPDGRYKATVYRDGKAGASPTETEVLVETIALDRTGIHELNMPSGGGFGIVLEKEVRQ